MKRYYILKNSGTISQPEWYVVPVMGEPVDDDCFYRKNKWCGENYLELNDTATGVFILRARTLDDLARFISDENLQARLKQIRNSDYYLKMKQGFEKALEEYKERVKGGKK